MIVEKKTVERLQIEHSHSRLALKVFDPKKPNSFWFVSASDFREAQAKRKTPISYQAVMGLDRYYAFTKASLKEMLKNHFHNFYNCTTPRGSTLLRMSMDDNLLFQIDSYVPFSTPFRFDPCFGGLNSEHFDLQKAAKILKKRKYVTDIRICEYPSYYDEDLDARYIACVVHLPQRTYADLYRTAMASRERGTGSPAYYMREFLTYKPWFGYDFLGVKPAYIGDKKT